MAGSSVTPEWCWSDRFDKPIDDAVAVFSAHANIGSGLGHDLFGGQPETAEFVGAPARGPARQHRFGGFGMELAGKGASAQDGLRTRLTVSQLGELGGLFEAIKMPLEPWS